MATRICPLTATGDWPLMATSPRFVVAFRAGKVPFGQHDFAGYVWFRSGPSSGKLVHDSLESSL